MASMYHLYDKSNLNRESLIKDPDFLSDARSFLQGREGYSDQNLSDPEDLYDAYLEHFRVQNVNEVTAAKDLNYAYRAEDNELQQFGRLMSTYDKVDNEYSLSMIGDYVGGIATSPSTYASLFTAGGAKAGALVAQKGVQLTLRKVLKDALARQALTKTAIQSSAVEAAGAGATVGLQEQARVLATDQEKINWKNVSLATGISASAGGLLSLPITGRQIVSGNKSELLLQGNKKVLEEAIANSHSKYAVPIFNGTTGSRNADKTSKHAKQIRQKLLLPFSDTIPELLTEGKILQEVPSKLQKIDQFKDGRPYAIAAQELDNISAAGASIIDEIDTKLAAIGDRDFGEGVERFGSKLSYALSKGLIDGRTVNPILRRHNIQMSQLGPLVAEELSRAGTLLGIVGTATKSSTLRYKRNVEALNHLDDLLLANGVSSLTRKARESLMDEAPTIPRMIWNGTKVLSKTSVGMMTIQLATTVRNTNNGYMRNFTYALDEFSMGRLNQLAGKLGRPWNINQLRAEGIPEEDIPKYAELLVKQGQAQVKNSRDSIFFKDLLFGITSPENQALFKILQDPSFGHSDEVAKLVRGLGDIAEVTGTEKGLLGATRYANTLNTLSDNMFKRAIYYRELNKLINIKPIKIKNADETFTELNSLDNVMREGQFSQVPSEYISEAMTEAFEYTYQFSRFREMEGGANQIANWFLKAGSNPFGALVAPFPRYLVNQFRFWYTHTPVLGSINFGGILNKPGVKGGKRTGTKPAIAIDGETLGKQMTGMATLGTFLAMRTLYGDETTGAYTYYNPVNNKKEDFSAFLGPYSMFSFAVDALYRSDIYGIRTGREQEDFDPYNNLVRSLQDHPIKKKELLQAAFGQLGKGGSGLYLVDAIVEAIQGAGDNNEDLARSLSKIIGTIPGRAIVGAGMLKDIAATTDTPFTSAEDYLTLPDNSDVDFMKIFMLSATRSLPLRFDIDGKKIDLADYIRGKDHPLREDLNNPLIPRKIYRVNPIIKQLSGITPKDIGSEISNEFDRLRLEWKDYTPKNLKGGDYLNNIAKRMMAMEISTELPKEINDEGTYLTFKTNEAKENYIKRRLSEIRTRVRKKVLNFNLMAKPDSESDQDYIQDWVDYQRHTFATRFENLSNTEKRKINQAWKVYKSKKFKDYLKGSMTKDLRALQKIPISTALEYEYDQDILSGTKQKPIMSLEAMEFLSRFYGILFTEYKIKKPKR